MRCMYLDSGGGGGGAPFSAVELLLPFNDGADGSDTYIDYSSYAHSITPAGNVEIDTAWSKFGLGGDKSALLSTSGTNGSLNSTVTAWNPRTTPFCIEAHLHPTSLAGGWCLMSAPAGDFFFHGYADFVVVGGSGSATNISNGYGFSVGDAKHIALTFDGTTYRYFVDGALLGSITTLLPSVTITSVRIGDRIGGTGAVDGHIDNFRFTLGYPVYTAAFTPPSGPHPEA